MKTFIDKLIDSLFPQRDVQPVRVRVRNDNRFPVQR